MRIPHSDAVSEGTGAPEGEALPWRSPSITGEFVTGKNDSEKEPVRLAGRIHPPGGPPDERHAARRTAAPQQEPSRQDIRIDGNIDDPAQEQGRGATRYYAQCRAIVQTPYNAYLRGIQIDRQPVPGPNIL